MRSGLPEEDGWDALDDDDMLDDLFGVNGNCQDHACTA